MRASDEKALHFAGEQPAQNSPHHVLTRAMEDHQISTAKVVRTAPPTQEFMPLGYNREQVLDKVARADFWGFNYGLDPNLEAEYNKNGKINFEQYVRSTTQSYGTNSNQFIWDSIPELENLPVSGYPNKTQQQYVLYNVEPAFLAATKSNLHISMQSVPTAYNAVIPTQKTQMAVYQTPVSTLKASLSGNSLLTTLKTFLVGGG